MWRASGRVIETLSISDGGIDLQRRGAFVANDKMKSAVLDWLEKQGYPLEMHVAEEFRKAGFEVTQSEFYLDPDTNQPREVDVLATNYVEITPTERVVRIRFVIECKRSRDKPWVMFVPPDTEPYRSLPVVRAMVANNQGKAL